MANSVSPRKVALWAGLLTAVAVATGITLFLVWLFLGGGAWHGGVSIVEALPHSETTLVLNVAACKEAPSVSFFRETDSYVEVEVAAYSTLLGDELHCLEAVNIYLEDPLGDRPLIDRHTGRPVNVITSENGEGN